MGHNKQLLSWKVNKKYHATLEHISNKPLTTEILNLKKSVRTFFNMSNKFIGRFDKSMLEEIIELEKRYNKTYIWAKLPEINWKLFWISTVQDSGIGLYNSEVGDIFLKTQTDIELEVRWPENKFFDYQDTIYWGHKIPDRQWKRAPCNKNFGFHRTLDQLFSGGKTVLFTKELIEASFKENKPTSILEIINNLKKTEITSRTHGNNFAVSLPPIKKDFFLLWYRNRPVAEIHVPKKEIVVRYPFLKQEIMDFNRDYELNSWNLK